MIYVRKTQVDINFYVDGYDLLALITVFSNKRSSAIITNAYLSLQGNRGNNFLVNCYDLSFLITHFVISHTLFDILA